MQVVREFSKKQNIEEEKVLVVGIIAKAREFVPTGGEICHGNMSDSSKLSL